MTYQADADRMTRAADPLVDPVPPPQDPRVDPALRDVPPTTRTGSPMLWILAGLVILLGIFAFWGGMFDGAENNVTTTTAPPAVEQPATPPAPAPAPAQ